MAHTAADGSKWTNASQARKVPGRAQGDGKQPVKKFSKPEAPRASTAEPVTSSPMTDSDHDAAAEETTQDPSQVVSMHGPAQHVEIDHADGHSVRSKHADGHEHHSKHASAEEAHAAASTLGGVGPAQPVEPMPNGNPVQAMM